jgi:hypothetical protein
MAEEKPSLHIDTDWKRQAQEEKKKLAEEEAKKAATAAPAAAPAGVGPGPSARMPGGPARPGQAMPPASFSVLVQSLLTQILFYLGDLAQRGAEPQVNLDMAKHQIDILGILEEKTRGNVTDDEKRMLDAALYEVRMRYVSVASQFIS